MYVSFFHIQFQTEILFAIYRSEDIVWTNITNIINIITNTMFIYPCGSPTVTKTVCEWYSNSWWFNIKCMCPYTQFLYIVCVFFGFYYRYSIEYIIDMKLDVIIHYLNCDYPPDC